MSETETKKEPCTCPVCIRMKRLFSLAKTKEDKEFIGSVLDDLEEAETDATFWKMKYKGEWPSAYDDVSPSLPPPPQNVLVREGAGDLFPFSFFSSLFSLLMKYIKRKRSL